MKRTKRQKLFIQCQHFKERKWQQKQTKKWWHSPFSVSRGGWTGRCLVCKSIRVHAHTPAHTQTHTHVCHPQTGFSARSVLSGRWSEGALKFYTCFCDARFPSTTAYFYSVISYVFHRMTWQHPENLLGLIFHFRNRRTDGSSESERFQLREKKLKKRTPCCGL